MMWQLCLAEAVAGTNDAFVERMNATAAKLGMTRTKFLNANGLPHEDQVTTARDLARLASAVVRDYPEHAAFWSTLDVHIGKRHFGTYNSLLVNYAGADGMKTGFTCDSGYNVVASATRSGQKLIAVVLGEATGGRRTIRASACSSMALPRPIGRSCFRPSGLTRCRWTTARRRRLVSGRPSSHWRAARRGE